MSVLFSVNQSCLYITCDMIYVIHDNKITVIVIVIVWTEFNRSLRSFQGVNKWCLMCARISSFGIISWVCALVLLTECKSACVTADTLEIIELYVICYIPCQIKQTFSPHVALTHWGRVTHICVSNLTIIGSDNGLSPGRRQAITWTNVEILLIGPLGTNFSEILIEIHTFSFKKFHLKMSSA